MNSTFRSKFLLQEIQSKIIIEREVIHFIFLRDYLTDLAGKVPVFKAFLVRMRENTDQKKLRKQRVRIRYYCMSCYNSSNLPKLF